MSRQIPWWFAMQVWGWHVGGPEQLEFSALVSERYAWTASPQWDGDYQKLKDTTRLYEDGQEVVLSEVASLPYVTEWLMRREVREGRGLHRMEVRST